MTIENPGVVDFVSVDPQTDDVVLTVSDHLDWRDEAAHLVALEEKLNAYMAFVESGELIERYPYARDRRVRIEIVTEHELSQGARTYIGRAGSVLRAAGVDLRARRLDERASNQADSYSGLIGAMTERLKIRFPFTNSAGQEEIETLWVQPRVDGYELDNIPFYVKELALGDLVAADSDSDGALWYSGLIEASGHSTIRLWFSSKHDVREVRDRLRGVGCMSELSDLPRLVAVDVPPTVPYSAVKELLDEWETQGTLEYQEACLGQV